MYSTCSLSPAENDDVVARLLVKSRVALAVRPLSLDATSLLPTHMPFGAATALGWHILPDNNPHGFGPIYLCVIQRTAAPDTAPGSSESDNDDADLDAAREAD